MKDLFILLGTNIGNRLDNLEEAKSLIRNDLGSIERGSSIYETEAWGRRDQNSFYNQIVLLRLDKLPLDILKITQNIEQKMGRVRKEHWGVRIIDIDLLYYGSEIVVEENLNIPHLQIQNRRFTLVPMVELAANLPHPILGKTQEALLDLCEDKLEVRKV